MLITLLAPGPGICRFYDRLAGWEVERQSMDVPGRLSFGVHRHFLQRQICSDHRDLEVGADPRRFAVALATLGARVIVSGLLPQRPRPATLAQAAEVEGGPSPASRSAALTACWAASLGR